MLLSLWLLVFLPKKEVDDDPVVVASSSTVKVVTLITATGDMSVDVDVDVDTRAAVVASCKVNDVGHTTTSVATTVDDDDDEFAVVVASSSIGQVVKNDEVFVRRDLDHGVTPASATGNPSVVVTLDDADVAPFFPGEVNDRGGIVIIA
mmetsp:Transcript_21610/g.24005  ORF Transcript_21610/g.24005 Transcript_21610/m.24005 type:complete len:149 (-) Transcript_21610:477-923(-)